MFRKGSSGNLSGRPSDHQRAKDLSAKAYDKALISVAKQALSGDPDASAIIVQVALANRAEEA